MIDDKDSRFIKRVDTVAKILFVICAALLVGFVVATLPGCVPQGYVKASSIEPTFLKVRVRHDAYVDADSNLSPLQKRVYKRSTQIIQMVIDAEDEIDEQTFREYAPPRIHIPNRYNREEHEAYCLSSRYRE